MFCPLHCFVTVPLLSVGFCTSWVSLELTIRLLIHFVFFYNDWYSIYLIKNIWYTTRVFHSSDFTDKARLFVIASTNLITISWIKAFYILHFTSFIFKVKCSPGSKWTTRRILILVKSDLLADLIICAASSWITSVNINIHLIQY